MEDKPRGGKPYTWVTWIAGLLAGSSACEWAAWYKSHRRYAKRLRDESFLAEWTKQHDGMVESRARRLLEAGYAVSVEDDNAFKLEGRVAFLAGKPDIVALKDDHAIIVDEKSGKVRQSDAWQVYLYIFAMPLAVPMLADVEIIGEVEYRAGSIPVANYTPEIKVKIMSMMRMIGSPVEPPRVPSQHECGFCDIVNCPDRIESEVQITDASEYF